MERVAENVREALREEYSEACLVGVSYYDEEGVGHVYRSEWAAEKYEPEQVDAIVEDLRLEALGHEVYERQQEESLHATVRIYDEILDVAVPVTEVSGVAFALDKSGEYDLRGVVDVVEEAIEESDVERTALA